jgi:ubiquinone/menaquinone biosynthesis C-methylase UbiE
MISFERFLSGISNSIEARHSKLKPGRAYLMEQHTDLVDTAKVALSKISAGHILDVATGSGGFITFLKENLKDYSEITGIDRNEQSLKDAAKSHSQENIHFLWMDASLIDFADRTFDTVCMANSMHHMADLPKVFSEVMRVCKPGGYIIFREMYRNGQSETQLTQVLFHHWRAAIDTAKGITHNETFTRQQILEMSRKLGLQDLKYYDEIDLKSDPKDPDLLRRLDSIIDQYIQYSRGMDGGEELVRRGEELHQRVHEIGFHDASSLLLIGKTLIKEEMQ